MILVSHDPAVAASTSTRSIGVDDQRGRTAER